MPIRLVQPYKMPPPLPPFKAFENDCRFSGGLNRGFKNVKNGYHWQQHSPLMKWTVIKLWETVHPPLS